MPRASASALRVDERRPRRTVTITGRPDKHAEPPPRLREVPHAGLHPAQGRSRLREVPAPTVPAVRAPRIVEIERRRPRARATDRLGPRPDRVAMWAVLMALFLVLVTVVSSHAGG